MPSSIFELLVELFLHRQYVISNLISLDLDVVQKTADALLLSVDFLEQFIHRLVKGLHPFILLEQKVFLRRGVILNCLALADLLSYFDVISPY